MCAKCNELDEKIAHYAQLVTHISDQLTLEGIRETIGRMTAEKAALHSESES
jgi:hypothetical protein